MGFLTTLPGLALLTKCYSAYAFSLAFILQSSLTLLLALAACVLYIWLRRRVYQRSLSLQPVKAAEAGYSKVVYKAK